MALEHLARLVEAAAGSLTVIVDEFTYLIRHEPTRVSVFQKMWDIRLYHVRDAFLRFYCRFIVPHITSIERGLLTPVVRTINDDLRTFIGAYTFEDLCREWGWVDADRGNLGFIPEMVGAYWGRSRGKGVQLDVVAASRREKRLFIAEAKWKRGSVSRRILSDLVTRSQRMPEMKNTRPHCLAV